MTTSSASDYVSLDTQQHYDMAQILLGESQKRYDDLKAVPKRSWLQALLHGGLTQRQERDDIGKQIAGLHAQALVHATLANFPQRPIGVD